MPRIFAHALIDEKRCLPIQAEGRLTGIWPVLYTKGDGLRVFHPTDPQLIDWLAEYLEEHGVLQSETTSG